MIKKFLNTEIDCLYEESLKKYNTYRVNTIAKYLVHPKDIEELIIIIKECQLNNIRYLILGNGSNIIFETEYFDGVIIKLDKLNSVKYEDNIVTVEAGYNLSKLALEVTNKGLKGLVFASCIPGAVGASIAMNAGAYNHDMSEILKSVKVLTPSDEVITMTKEELNFNYRDSFFKHNKDYIILEATLEFEKDNKDILLNELEEKKQKRLNTQPLDKPNAGSVFRNPDGMHAGEMIEKLNLKGFSIGDAEVSTKHANFIVNKGNATGKDIVNLINRIKEEVKREYKVDLILEQIIIK